MSQVGRYCTNLHFIFLVVPIVRSYDLCHHTLPVEQVLIIRYHDTTGCCEFSNKALSTLFAFVAE